MSARSVGLALKSALTAPVVSAFVILVVALVSFAGSAAPALMHTAQSETVQAALVRQSPVLRDLSGLTAGIARPGTGTSEPTLSMPTDRQDVWGVPIDVLERTREGFAEALRDVLGDPRIIVASEPVSTVADEPRPLNRVRLTFDPTYDERVTFVEGRAPEPRAPEPLSPTDETEVAVFEIALSREAGEALDWPVGEVRHGGFSNGPIMRMELTGLYEVDDETDGEWTHEPTGAAPAALVGPMGDVTQYATAYSAPEALGTTLHMSDWFSTRAWLPLVPDRVDGQTAADLGAQLRAASGAQVPMSVALESRYPLGLALSSSAPPVIDAAVERATAMTGIVAFVAVGPFAVAIVVLALAGRLIATRRVRPARLAAARGASTQLLGVVMAGEGLLLGLVGAVIGVVPAVLLTGFEGAASLFAPLVVALTPAVVLPWLTLSLAQQRGRHDLGAPVRGHRVRRIAVEIAIVLGAALITLLAVTGSTGVDPTLVVLPLALSAAACVVALRTVPLLLAAVESRTPRTRGLVPLIGPARGRRDASVRTAPVLAVVLGVAVALFSVAFWATMDAGIRDAARIQAGAGMRVESTYLSQQQVDEMRSLDGVAAAAEISTGSRIELKAGGRTVRAMAYITDVGDLAAVQDASGAGTIPVPSAMADAASDSIPVAISAELAHDLRDDEPTLRGTRVDVLATAPESARPGVFETWVLVDEAQVGRIGAVHEGTGTVLMALEPDADADALADEVQRIAGPAATVSTPESDAEAFAADPALRAVYVSLATAAIVVAVLLALAVGMTLVLGAPSRGRLLALLAALGYPRRRDVPFVLWEVAPALLLALPFGVAVGLALPYLAIPRLELSAFLGGVLEPAVRLGGWMPVAVVAGFVLVAGVAVLTAAVAASRITAAFAIRSSDEEG